MVVVKMSIGRRLMDMGLGNGVIIPRGRRRRRSSMQLRFADVQCDIRDGEFSAADLSHTNPMPPPDHLL